jgi:hypothetical protein
MEPNSNKYEDWPMSGDGSGGGGHGSEEDDNHSAGVPVDIEMIVQAHETDDFWLPSPPSSSTLRNTVDTVDTQTTMTIPIQRAGGNDASFGRQGSYIRQSSMGSSAAKEY